METFWIMITLIYCAKGNRRFSEIAAAAGFQLGAQLPGTIYFPLYFADQNWKKPNRAAYMAVLEQHRPVMASVLDLERREQLSEVLDWAEEAAQWSQSIMIIPKVSGIIQRLPRRIGDADVVLGYSIPTRHGGTSVWSSEFFGWPIHLLGGSPHAQMRHAARMRGVVSADGNMANLLAHRCRFWRQERGLNGHWIQLSECGDGDWGVGANAEAFRRSCENIMQVWKSF
jgi:hypothetical protein